jgi:TPR repeat protein
MRFFVIFVLLLIGMANSASAQIGSGPRDNATLQSSCENGKAVDCSALGFSYAKGNGVAKDTKRAAALYLRACDVGEAEGCFDLAFSHLDGDGVAKNPKKAAAYFLRACDNGFADGCSQLAISYETGSGVKQDDASTARYADRGCKGYSAIGCMFLGAVYEKGLEGYPKSIDRAVGLYRYACNHKRPLEQACARLDKLGYARQVAKQNVPPPVPQVDRNAIANSAVTAGNAAHARKDYKTAASQFAEACDNGSTSACGALGSMYIKGEGVRSSGAGAAAPLAKACDGGIAASCGKLGTLYDAGNGVRANKARAFGLFNGACSRSDMASCYNLGRLYESGQGTAANVAQAASLYQKACTAGIADGCSSVGTMYANGVHFAQSESQAEAFYKLACKNGGATGCEFANRILAEKRRRQELAVANSANAKKSASQNRPLSSSKISSNPKDCLEKEKIAKPERRTYVECDKGDCKTYYQDSVSQAADDGLYYIFNTPGFNNYCSRDIVVTVKYDEPLLSGETFRMIANEKDRHTRYIEPIVVNVVWAK